MSEFFNVTMTRADDGMAVTAASNVIRLWADDERHARIQTKVHYLPRGWMIESIVADDEVAS